MEEFKEFLIRFRYQIIGALIAILLLCTGLYKIVLSVLLIIARNICWLLFWKK